MADHVDKIGIVRDHRWFRAAAQYKRLEAEKVRGIIEMDGSSVKQADVIRMATDGRTFVLVHAFLLADPRQRKTRGGMKANFNATVEKIAARGGVIQDLETGLTTEDKQHRKAIIALAHNHIARSNQGLRSALNGTKSRGRPSAWADTKERQIIWDEWHSAANKTNGAASKAASKRIGRYVSANRMWRIVKEMRVERGLKGKGASGRRNTAKVLAAAVGVAVDDNMDAPKAPPPKRGVVYFVKNGVRDRVKIGFSERHTVRLSTLQGATPDTLTLIGVLPGTAKLERRMHKRFKAYREKGEWFRIEGTLAAYMKRLRKPQQR